MDKRFEELLLLYGQENEKDKRQKIEATLWREFGKVKAVFVMDMAGFSLLSYRHGIVHYLSMVRRMQLTTSPLLRNTAARWSNSRRTTASPCSTTRFRQYAPPLP